MPYVQRNAAGAIVGAFANPQPGIATELVADGDAGLVSFLAPKPTPPTPREWLERLSSATQAAIFGAAASNPSILGWVIKASGAQAIDVTAQETKDGVAYLASAGVITAADQTTLLAP